MSTTYYGSVPADLTLEDFFQMDAGGQAKRDEGGSPIPLVYSHASYLAEWIWGNPCWQQDAAWLDAFDALRTKLHKQPAGTAWELSTDEREKLLTAMRTPYKAYPDALRPQLTPFFRALVSASTQKPKAVEPVADVPAPAN